MYVDTSLIDFNLQVVNIDGVDCIVNYAYQHKDIPHSNQLIYIYDEDGVNSTKCIVSSFNKNTDETMWRVLGRYDYAKPILISKSDYDGFTMTSWIKTINSSNIRFCRYGGIFVSCIDIPNKKFYFSRGAGQAVSSSSKVTMSIVPPIDEWFYLTITYSANGTCKLYINGQLSARVSLAMISNVEISMYEIDPVNSVSNPSNTVYIDDPVAVRTVLWTENFEPPTTRLLDIDYDSFDIDMKVHNNLIAYPNINRVKNILKVY